MASVRFHRIAHQMEERCHILLQPHRWLPHTDDVEPLKKTLRELTARKEAIGESRFRKEVIGGSQFWMAMVFPAEEEEEEEEEEKEEL